MQGVRSLTLSGALEGIFKRVRLLDRKRIQLYLALLLLGKMQGIEKRRSLLKPRIVLVRETASLPFCASDSLAAPSESSYGASAWP